MKFCCLQAEDGIQDIGVAGVQTCALPIWEPSLTSRANASSASTSSRAMIMPLAWSMTAREVRARSRLSARDRKSVVQGKSVDLGGRRIIKKQHLVNESRYRSSSSH